MIVRDYERAKALARDCTDEGLASKQKRYERISMYTALAAIASFAMITLGARLFHRLAPGFEASYPLAYMVVTMYLPAIGIATFFISGQILDGKRGVVALAKRLKREAAGEEG